MPYSSIFKNDSCEIYEYIPYHQKPKPAKIDCPFCFPENEIELITESATAFAISDKYPVSTGHTLIIPKRHVDNYFDLTFREQSACIFMVNFVKELLQIKYNPDGYNIGINIGPIAGQSIFHSHIHLIPRYQGDVDNPIGGVRGVVPEMKDYSQR